MNGVDLNRVGQNTLASAQAVATSGLQKSPILASSNTTGTWSVTEEPSSGVTIAGEEPVSDAALERNDALGQLINKAYGI